MGEHPEHEQHQETYIDQIKKIKDQQPNEKLAWAWQNFIKRHVNGTDITECIRLLYEELQEPLPENHNLRSILSHDNPSTPITEADINVNVSELHSFLNGELAIQTSKFFQLISTNNPNSLSKTPESSIEIRELLGRYYKLMFEINSMMQEIEDRKTLLEIQRKLDEIKNTYTPENITQKDFRDLEELKIELNKALKLEKRQDT